MPAHPLHTVAEIRQIEAAALAALPAGTLMQRAGRASAELALRLLSTGETAAEVLILAGPGNNGGDALEAAYLLAEAAVQTSVVCWADGQQPKDAQQALQRARSGKVKFIDPASATAAGARHWDLVIDGLFGIGLKRPISSAMRDWIEVANRSRCPVLALDVPSGLDADTGDIVGGDPDAAIRATHTITFLADKPGLHTCFGREHAGQVQLARLDVTDSRLDASDMHLNDVEAFAAFLGRRSHNSHKGTYGDVIVIGGAAGMAGAPVLAGVAAAKSGAGRVFVAFLDAPPAYDSMHPELMCRRTEDVDFSTGALVLGPGLGISRQANDILVNALHAPTPLVLDADALNLIVEEPGLQQMLLQRKGATLMTPHPLEAARLLQTSAKDVQADRLGAARELARRFKCVAVLKGSGSIIAHASGELRINPTGGPALATAGTGDVLAGVCGALLAQSFPAWNAALAAAWLHGRAGDVLSEQLGGTVGLTASELIPGIRTILNQLIANYAVANPTQAASEP